MKKSDKQARDEIEKLREIQPKVRKMTLFGDDNHKAILAQVKVLEGRLDEDTIYNRWENNDHLRDAALEAWAWLNGEGEKESLVTGWESLVE